MKKENRDLLFNIFAILCSLWFLVYAGLWTYCINLFVGYPIGLLGLYLWYKGLNGTVLSKIVLVILILGMAFSIVAFFLF